MRAASLSAESTVDKPTDKGNAIDCRLINIVEVFKEVWKVATRSTSHSPVAQ